MVSSVPSRAKLFWRLDPEAQFASIGSITRYVFCRRYATSYGQRRSGLRVPGDTAVRIRTCPLISTQGKGTISVSWASL